MGYSIFDETMVEMMWPDVEKAIREGAVVLLPTGVIEEHGPHMSLGVDTYMSYLVCRLIKHELYGRGLNALIAPPIYWGINDVTGAFTGSFTLRVETMKALLHDILASLKRWGVEFVFNINWHDDYHHCRTLLDALKETSTDTGITACSIISDLLARRIDPTGKEYNALVYKMPFPEASAPKALDIHAGSGETSTMVKYFPGEVDTALASTLQAAHLTYEEFMIWRKGWGYAKTLTPMGYLGDPSSFSTEDGRQFVEYISKAAAGLIDEFLKKHNYQTKE